MVIAQEGFTTFVKDDEEVPDDIEAFRASEGVPDALVETFGQSVTYHRERAGLSQTALARATGLSQATISLIEAGERTPSVTNARAIARALGVSLNALVGDPVDGFSPGTARLARAIEALPSALRSSIQDYLDFLSVRSDSGGKAADETLRASPERPPGEPPAGEPPAGEPPAGEPPAGEPLTGEVGREQRPNDTPRAAGRTLRRPRR